MSSHGESLSLFVVQRTFTLVRRGYDPEEVDQHLQRVNRMFMSTEAGKAFSHERAALQERERELERLHGEAERALEGARLEAEARASLV